MVRACHTAWAGAGNTPGSGSSRRPSLCPPSYAVTACTAMIAVATVSHPAVTPVGTPTNSANRTLRCQLFRIATPAFAKIAHRPTIAVATTSVQLRSSLSPRLLSWYTGVNAALMRNALAKKTSPTKTSSSSLTSDSRPQKMRKSAEVAQEA